MWKLHKTYIKKRECKSSGTWKKLSYPVPISHFLHKRGKEIRILQSRNELQTFIPHAKALDQIIIYRPGYPYSKLLSIELPRPVAFDTFIKNFSSCCNCLGLGSNLIKIFIIKKFSHALITKMYHTTTNHFHLGMRLLQTISQLGIYRIILWPWSYN